MAKLIVNGALAMGAINLTTDTNRIAVQYGLEEKEQTAFGDTFKNYIPGTLKTFIISAGGFNEYADPDSTVNAAIATNVPVTAAAGTAEGSGAYFMNAIVAKYTPLEGAVGDPLKFEFGSACADRAIRGVIAGYGSKASTSQGTGTLLGAVSATQSLYAVLHVISCTGTLDVIVQSDDNAGFTSATTVLTFSQFTGAGSALISVAGALTDTYYRMKWTIGTGPSNIIGAFGIY